METLRIAILECDTPITPVIKQHGTYGDIFKRMIASGLSEISDAKHRLQPIFSTWDVVTAQAYPSLDDVDVIFLTGSRHNSFDNDEWIIRLVNFVSDVYHQTQTPLVGICFGHQIIARALGAEVARSPSGWETSVCDVTLEGRGPAMFGKKTVALHQMHRDAVLSIPAGLENLGSSPRCGIQGLFREGRVCTLQAHPEFNEFIMADILDFRHDQGIFDSPLYHDALSRSTLAHDGKVVSVAICNFILKR